MDNLTHTLTGVMLSRTGLGRLAPRGTLLLALAANIPDCDVVSWLWGSTAYFHYHRWYTHAVLLTPVMALLPLLAIRLIVRGEFPWRRAYLVSLVGTVTHPLLDFTNPYGIRLLLPFSDAWPRLDTTHVIDLWIWGVLFLAIAAPAISRLVSSEMGAKSRSGRGWAVLALAFLLVYNSGRVVLRQRAVAVQEARLYDGATPRRATVFPNAFNPLRWKGVVETDEFFVIQEVDLTRELDPGQGRVVHKGEGHPAMEAARTTQAFQDMMGFSSALLWRATPDAEVENATRVEARDLRFGFSTHAIVNAANQVERSWFEFSEPAH